MALFTFGPNSRMYWDQFDLTSDMREASFEISTDALEKTAWGDSAHVYRAGLDTINISGSGHQSHGSGEVDESLSAELGTDESIISMGSNVSAEGDILYVAKGLMAQYTPLQGTVGDQATFGFAAQSGGGWFRGKLLADKAARTSSSASTGIQLGTVAAASRMHASLHIFAVSGSSPTLDVIVQSDDNSGFSSATTRLTFAQANAVGAQFLGPTAGPGGSDDYWRVSWTIGGTGTPTFNFAVVFGHERYG